VFDRVLGATDLKSKFRPFAPWFYVFGVLLFFFLGLALLLPFLLGAGLPDLAGMLRYVPSLLIIMFSALLVHSMARRRPGLCFTVTGTAVWALFLLTAFIYLPALENYRPVRELCRSIQTHSGESSETGCYRISLPSMVYYLRRPVFEEFDETSMAGRFRSERTVYCILASDDYRRLIENHDLNLYILDRRQRLETRLSALWEGGGAARREWLLVANRPGGVAESGIRQLP
jgi:hypothetical protein